MNYFHLSLKDIERHIISTYFNFRTSFSYEFSSLDHKCPNVCANGFNGNFESPAGTGIVRF